MGSSWRSEEPRERELDVAVEQTQDAVDLVAGQAERLHEATARVFRQIGARIGEPARAGRAVRAVETRELVDRESVEDVLAQEVALPNLELRERVGDRA